MPSAKHSSATILFSTVSLPSHVSPAPKFRTVLSSHQFLASLPHPHRVFLVPRAVSSNSTFLPPCAAALAPLSLLLAKGGPSLGPGSHLPPPPAASGKKLFQSSSPPATSLSPATAHAVAYHLYQALQFSESRNLAVGFLPEDVWVGEVDGELVVGFLPSVLGDAVDADAAALPRGEDVGEDVFRGGPAPAADRPPRVPSNPSITQHGRPVPTKQVRGVIQSLPKTYKSFFPAHGANGGGMEDVGRYSLGCLIRWMHTLVPPAYTYASFQSVKPRSVVNERLEELDEAVLKAVRDLISRRGAGGAARPAARSLAAYFRPPGAVASRSVNNADGAGGHMIGGEGAGAVKLQRRSGGAGGKAGPDADGIPDYVRSEFNDVMSFGTASASSDDSIELFDDDADVGVEVVNDIAKVIDYTLSMHLPAGSNGSDLSRLSGSGLDELARSRLQVSWRGSRLRRKRAESSDELKVVNALLVSSLVSERRRAAAIRLS
jgi:hypothetical protein